MTNKNTAALARFGELYKTAWTRLSERHDEIPHFAEIAASFDKITATQQGTANRYSPALLHLAFHFNNTY